MSFSMAEDQLREFFLKKRKNIKYKIKEQEENMNKEGRRLIEQMHR